MFCSAFSQELVKDSTYFTATSDTTFFMVTEKAYSNGVTQKSMTPVTPEEVSSNIKSFLEFKAREYQYAASTTYDLNRKVSLFNAANVNLKNTANIDVLAAFASQYQNDILGNYTLNGTAVTLLYQDGAMRWISGGNDGAVTVYSNQMISLDSYFNSRNVLLYKVGTKWVNCDGLFQMELQ